MENIKTDENYCVMINAIPLMIKEYDNKRVVGFKDIDTVHGRPDGTASRNFRTNRRHFKIGIDYYEINQPDEIRRLGFERPQGGTSDKVILVTETGYLMLVKSFTDDLAWNVQRQLVTSYFKVKVYENAIPLMYNKIEALETEIREMKRLLYIEPNNKKITNWKNKRGYPKVNELVGLVGTTFDETLNMIYERMGDRCGFLSYSALIDYKEKYHLDSVPYTIDAVADSPTYQRDFVVCANELIIEYKHKNNETVPVPTALDKFDATVRPLIELRGDKSARGAMTLKEVYKKMHTKQSWAVMKGKNKCRNKKKLIMKKDSEFELFCKTVSEMIMEFK